MASVAANMQVGQYVLLREIGRGAMATVYEARHAKLGKRVALKRMHPHLAADATASERFLREGRVAAQIHHDHVVDVFDVGAEDGVPYLVMELLDGVDLAEHLREKRRLSVTEIADVMLPVISAVVAAHDAGVVHRDLKPSNVVLARRGDGTSASIAPTVLDFGISKVTSEVDRDLTSSEVLLGTVHYMSPEQTRGARNASALSDQYALGVMLYECATGQKPFGGSTPYGLMHAIVSATFTTPRAIVPELPPAFDALVSRAMQRDPAKRFPDARALGAALTPWASDRATWEARFGAARADAPRRRGRGAIAAVAAVIVATIAFVGWRASRHDASSPAPASAVAATPPPSDSVIAAATATAPAAASESPRDASAPAIARASATAAAPVRSASARPAASAPERGTNGAPIVE